MSLRVEVLMWAVRIAGRPNDAAAHVLLDIKIDATIEEAQEAFHKIARTAHPDLHRAAMSPEEIEQVTSAYARVAGAYQEFRSRRAATTRIRPIHIDETIPPGGAKSPFGSTPGARAPAASTPSTTRPKTPSSSGHSLASGSNMNSKALIYYRKVEMCLRRGELKTAVLQMRMAIAADPQSPFLRSALVEIEAELAKSGG